ncbi:MAG: hypothetical protein NTY94_19375 [Alphaproteobacteria bacterium]|nr:hypothetical protein [Alphaproteobacteria bacterium]
MSTIPSPLATAFAALAAELRLRAGDGTGQGAQHAFHALILLGLIRVLWVLESMVRHWQSARPAAATGHTLLAARYPREKRPRRPLTPRIRADLKSITRRYQAPATITPPVSHARPRLQRPARARTTPRTVHTPTQRPRAFSKRAFQPVPNHALFIS